MYSIYLRDNCGFIDIGVCLKQVFELCRRHLNEMKQIPSGEKASSH